MTLQSHSKGYLASLVGRLRALPDETEWVEFKVNNSMPEMIGGAHIRAGEWRRT